MVDFPDPDRPPMATRHGGSGFSRRWAIARYSRAEAWSSRTRAGSACTLSAVAFVFARTRQVVDRPLNANDQALQAIAITLAYLGDQGFEVVGHASCPRVLSPSARRVLRVRRRGCGPARPMFPRVAQRRRRGLQHEGVDALAAMRGRGGDLTGNIQVVRLAQGQA
jgi:hypothetical protein